MRMSAALTCAALIAIAGCTQDSKPIQSGWVVGFEYIPSYSIEVNGSTEYHDQCWEIVITDYSELNYLCTTESKWRSLKKGDWFE